MLQEQANRLSSVLVAQGVQRGDRVAMALSLLFAPDALKFRLQDREAIFAISDSSALADLKLARKHCSKLRPVIGVGGVDAALPQAPMNADCESSEALEQFGTQSSPVQTLADDPAILIAQCRQPTPPLAAKAALQPAMPEATSRRTACAASGQVRAAWVRSCVPYATPIKALHPAHVDSPVAVQTTFAPP